jgi:hypothetical protein
MHSNRGVILHVLVQIETLNPGGSGRLIHVRKDTRMFSVDWLHDDRRFRVRQTGSLSLSDPLGGLDGVCSMYICFLCRRSAELAGS